MSEDNFFNAIEFREKYTSSLITFYAAKDRFEGLGLLPLCAWYYITMLGVYGVEIKLRTKLHARQALYQLSQGYAKAGLRTTLQNNNQDTLNWALLQDP